MMRIATMAAAAALVAGCAAEMGAGGGAGTTGAAGMSGEMTPTERSAYVRMAAASDLFEIQSSQLALQHAQRPEVRQFAQMLITHHTQTTQQLMAAAQASGMTPPPPMLMPMQQQMMSELQQATGAGFEQVYMRQQVPAHEMALALHQNYAARGDTTALRATAGAAVPIVQQHLAQARELSR